MAQQFLRGVHPVLPAVARLVPCSRAEGPSRSGPQPRPGWPAHTCIVGCVPGQTRHLRVGCVLFSKTQSPEQSLLPTAKCDPGSGPAPSGIRTRNGIQQAAAVRQRAGSCSRRVGASITRPALPPPTLLLFPCLPPPSRAALPARARSFSAAASAAPPPAGVAARDGGALPPAGGSGRT